MRNSITILVHGFNKNKHDMAYLENGLNKYGFKTFSVNLPATFGSFQKCMNSFALQVNPFIKNYTSINYIAHSMGGLFVREYISSTNQKNINRCVFIAVPHNGSKLATIASKIPFYSKVVKPIGSLLPNSKVFNAKFEIGIIAGNKNSGILGRLFLFENSDGRVEVSSAKSSDAKDMIILPFSHKEIHHKIETVKQVRRFLTTGQFRK